MDYWTGYDRYPLPVCSAFINLGDKDLNGKADMAVLLGGSASPWPAPPGTPATAPAVDASEAAPASVEAATSGAAAGATPVCVAMVGGDGAVRDPPPASAFGPGPAPLVPSGVLNLRVDSKKPQVVVACGTGAMGAACARGGDG